MNIVLYGVPAATAGRIADRYGLKLINSPDKFDASGTMVLVPSISAPRYLLAFYNAMLRHEDDVDGFTVAKRIRQNEETKDTPILMLTALSQINDKVKGFNIGVDDYLVKPFELEELLVRVRALLKRTNQIPISASTRDLLTLGEITLLPEQYSVKIGEKQAKLTPIEFDIFNLLFQNHGNMVSSAKLLKDIWGYSPDDDIETIRVHIRHLRSKIDKIADGKKYIETIYGGGYKLNV